jgi:hypothetical protein
VEFVWNPWAVPSLLAGMAGVLMAFPTYFAGPRRAQNRLLALFLFIMGGGLVGQALSRFSSTPDAAYAGEFLHWWLWTCTLPLYLLFISTIDSPVAKVLRRRGVQLVLSAVAIATPVVWLFFPHLWIEGVAQGTFETPWYPVGGPLLGPFALPHLAVSLLGLIVAISSYRTSPPGSVTRERAFGYALAFGVADSIMCVLIVLAAPLSPDRWAGWIALMSKPAPEGWGEAVLRPVLAAGWAVQFIALVLLFGYAILKSQLFDIDLKIKWGIRRGTVAAAFFAVFFIVEQLVQGVLSNQLGILVGTVCAGVLVFLLKPLERFAAKVADTALPQVEASPDYVASRKFFVYRGAVESAMEDGVVTQRERAVLQRLQRDLGIRAEDAGLIENEVVHLFTPPVPRALAT